MAKRSETEDGSLTAPSSEGTDPSDRGVCEVLDDNDIHHGTEVCPDGNSCSGSWLERPRREQSSRTLIVSSRLPVTSPQCDADATSRMVDNDFPSELQTLHDTSDNLWIGWPGPCSALREAAVFELHRNFISNRMIPVRLNHRVERAFYDDISNGVLWPVFHDRLERMPANITNWALYEEANQRFADAIAEEYRDPDVVWVHDYHLLRVPALLRNRVPRARIGFFLHTPFPNPDVFTVLARHQSLLQGMLGADLIGFQTERFRRNFVASIQEVLGATSAASTSNDVVTASGRIVRTGVFPMGIDSDEFGILATSRDTVMRTLLLRDHAQRLLLCVDRLDNTQGVVASLLAFEHLLRRHAEWRERVQFFQVVIPTRHSVTTRRRFRREVEPLIARINGRFATETWNPIQYWKRSISRETLVSLYRAATVMLATSLKEGMSLVAKQFVASRLDGDGVLVLSNFAGAAAELSQAVQVNPYDAVGVAEAMHSSLTMSRQERRSRMVNLRAQVCSYNVYHWSTTFIRTLLGESLSDRDSRKFEDELLDVSAPSPRNPSIQSHKLLRLIATPAA